MRKLRQVVGALLLGSLTAAAAGSWAGEYADDWGPAVGSSLPVLEAPDHTGQVRRLADLAGERGLLLFLSRSADW